MSLPGRLAGLLVLAFLGIALASTAYVGWEWTRHLRATLVDRMEGDLRSRAVLAEPTLRDAFETDGPRALDSACKRLGRETSTRFTWIDPAGTVLGDSEEDPGRMENHADRPEIRAAYAGRPGTSIRMSPTLQTEFLYVALPVKQGDEVVGVLRTSMTMSPVRDAVASARVRLFLAAGVLGLLSILVAVLVYRPLHRFTRRVREAAVRYADGDLDHRVPVSPVGETGEAASSLNRMAAQVQERIDRLTREGRAKDTLLASMVEGVIAVAPDERVLEINRAAGELLGVDPASIKGKILQEEIRNTDLQRFVRVALDANRVIEGSVAILEPEERFLQAHGTRIRVPERRRPGALIVLNDVTRLKRLESLRREFVSNVSHELRTPVTSIKGFVETLLDGPVDRAEDARRFHEIILKEANRLHAMLEDLLVLARVEQESERNGITFERTRVDAVVDAAVSHLREAAERKGITLSVSCPGDPEVDLHGTLMERALENLIDNAIHYSDPNTEIRVEAGTDGADLVLRVRDRGWGIPEEHLARIFERFYRVPAYRNGKPDGTGLGLAIVKHIAHSHHGRVEVESVQGEGTTMTIRIPRTGSR